MQTFLPYPDYAASAKVLDYKRLGQQRVECMQIYKSLFIKFDGITNKPVAGWSRHPAVKMWRGHEGALLAYATMICQEWIDRGYQDKLKPYFMERAIAHMDTLDAPPWFGDPAFHASHRSKLLRKDLGYYSKFGWSEDGTLPYVWPVR